MREGMSTIPDLTVIRSTLRTRLIDRARVKTQSAGGRFAQTPVVVLLAHVRSAFTLSNGTYGSPRMVHELRDNGLTIGRRPRRPADARE